MIVESSPIEKLPKPPLLLRRCLSKKCKLQNHNHRSQSRSLQKLWALLYLQQKERMIEQKGKKERLNNKRRLNGTMRSSLDMLLMSSIGKNKETKPPNKDELNNKKGIKTTQSYRFIPILTIVRRTKQTIKNLSSIWTCLTLKRCF